MEARNTLFKEIQDIHINPIIRGSSIHLYPSYLLNLDRSIFLTLNRGESKMRENKKEEK